MGTDSHRDSLIGVFLAEAAEGIGRITAALHPEGGALPPPGSLRDAYLHAHTLSGSAALYGFSVTAGLAEELEHLLDALPDPSGPDWPTRVARMRKLAEAIRARLDCVARTGGEDADEPPRATGSEPARGPAVEPAAAAEAFPDSYLLPHLDPEVFSYFAPEAQEYLDGIETALLKLDTHGEDPDTIQQLFRTAHTLKGSAYTVGFTAIGDLIHHVEDLMGAIREGRMGMTPALADLIFRVVDVIRLLMRRDERKLSETRRDFAAILARLKGIEPGAEPAPAQAVHGGPAPAPLPAVAAEPVGRDAAARPEEPASRLAPSGDRVEGAVIRVSRERLERLLNLVGELVISRGRLEQRIRGLEQLSQQVLACKRRMLDCVRTFEEKHAFTLPQAAAEGAALPSLPITAAFGSLEFDQYDDVNILARRIAEVSADVAESMAQLNVSIRKAREDMGQLHHLSLGMRDEIARARMVPIGTPFTRFRRAVREMARATGKEVTLVTSGERTEVDTGVVERLVDPLVHLVRNAVAHGIESPAVRLAKGKPAMGTVYLHAAHRGNTVVIEVEDDGAGLDLQKITARAVALGVLRPELAGSLPEAEAIKLIFLPGFSTAESVGDQAGRGVGLDVVKRAIEAMSGHISIETEPGVGTKFTLTLPLTLLITAALLVRVGEQRYAVPLSSIREVVQPQAGVLQDVAGRMVLQVGEQTVEVKTLAALLGQAPAASSVASPVVIVRTATGLAGLAVDDLLGQQEIVIKPLGSLRLLRESPFAGATLDPEGGVVLVLDPARLLAAGRSVEALAGTPPAALVGPEAGDGFPEAVGEAPGTVPRLLLIDDSLSVRKFVGRMLEGAGYWVDTAVDGEDGLRKASEGLYRLIITDLEMPKLNGYEVIQALRERPRTKATPILVMTTRAAEKHRQMALSMGASGYVTKPVEERALIQEVEQRIGGAAGVRA
ncbi:hybrid sensor histidine kinase/response regulator [Nitrospira sp. Kam-Ns4a]